MKLKRFDGHDVALAVAGGCLTTGAFLANPALGFAVLGLCIIAGVLVSASGVTAPKDR
jgi:hypothetical protein